MNTCVICGKQYEPYYCYGDRQKTCSKECRKEYARLYARNNPKKYEYMEKMKQRKKERINGHVICKLCGKPVYRTFILGEGSPQMHYQCVIDDCIATIRPGEKLNRKQIARLEQRGYSKTEFIEEYKDEIKAG